MQWKKWLGVGLLAGAMLAVAACGGGGGGNQQGGGDQGDSVAADGKITVEVDEAGGFFFVPDTINATAGQEVTVVFHNTGAVVHDFTIEGLDEEVTSGTVAAGETKEITFTAPSTGEYKIVCTQPGHEAAGMTGTLVVQ